MSEEEKQLDTVVELVRLAAQILLKNGAETYRAEDTVIRICRSYGYEPSVIALPTGVMITIQAQAGTRTVISRIEVRTVDLSRIAEVNELSRRITRQELTYEAALCQMRQLSVDNPQNIWKLAAYGAASAGFFAIMFKGGWMEFLAAFAVGFAVQLVVNLLPERAGLPAVNLLGGMLTAGLSLMFTWAFQMPSADTVIAGALMPMLPGLVMTNAIRDAMHGDLVSGVARAVDAILRAVLLAAGAGVALTLMMMLEAVKW